MGSIYIIKNNINNKVYIGQTIQALNIRLQNHKMASRIEDTKFYRAMRKYGEDNFFIELLETVSNDKLDERERYWIKEYDSYYNGYNSTLGGNGTPRIDYNLIIQEWKQGKSVKQISDTLKLDRTTVSRILKTVFNISVEDIKQRGYQLLYSLTPDFILEQWNQGLTPHQISIKYGGDTNTIKKVLSQFGITDIDFKKRANMQQHLLSEEKVLKLWKMGLNITQISKIGGNRQTIRNILLTNGITEQEIDQRKRDTCNKNAKPVVQLTQDDIYLNTFPSAKKAGESLGKPSTSINGCCNHKPKYRTAYGFKWMFLDEYIRWKEGSK